jgi:tRNA A-37 threonylcarbamoyl transferase component Bud32
MPAEGELYLDILEARVLCSLGRFDEAMKIAVTAQVRLESPTPSLSGESVAGQLARAMLGDLYMELCEFDRWESCAWYDREQKQYEDILREPASASPMIQMAAAQFTVSCARSKLQSKEYTRSIQLTRLAVPVLERSEGAPKPLLYWTYLQLATVFCWQYNWIDAEELSRRVRQQFSETYGWHARESVIALIVLGFVLMNRGKFESAIEVLTLVTHVAYPTSSGLNATLEATCLVLVHQYIALGRLCLGASGEAKHASIAAYRDAEQYDVNTSLIARCVGCIEAIDKDYTAATTWLTKAIMADEDEDSSTRQEYSDRKSIGSTVARWSLAWVQHEQGAIDEALKTFGKVLISLQSLFGDDHKFTIECEHDLLWTNRNRFQASQTWQDLWQKSSIILSSKHPLTRKIATSKAMYQELEPILTMSWFLGERVGVSTQLSSVDRLTWSWSGPKDEDVILSLRRSMTNEDDLRMPEEETVLLSKKAQDKPANTSRSLLTTAYQAVLRLINKLLDDFPRDFSPVFIESTYRNVLDVPYKELEDISSRKMVRVRHRQTDQHFVRKELLYNKESRQKVHDEVNTMKALSHSHIAKLCCSYILQSEKKYALLMQPVADMNLFAYLEKCTKDGYPETMLKLLSGWFACLLSALDYMHARKIKHRDIKPHNILVKGDMVYITDFGSARDWNSYETSRTRDVPTGYTEKYQAPEVEPLEEASEDEKGRSVAADVFSMGCTFAEMATILITRRSISDFDNYRSENERCDSERFDIWVRDEDSNLDSDMKSWFANSSIYDDFLKDMMAKEEKMRPSSRELVTRLETGLSGGFGSLVCSHRPSTTDRA